MGYSTTFRIKGELDKQFVSNSWVDTSHLAIRKSRMMIISSCLKNWENKESQAFDEIWWQVKAYETQLIEKWKKNLVSEIDREDEYTKKGEVDFYGWEHANVDNTWTEESLGDYFSEELFLIALSDGGSRFDTESNYHKKIEEIVSYVDDIEGCVDSMMDGIFIERYRDSEDADEDDGDKHRFPEDIKKEEK